MLFCATRSFLLSTARALVHTNARLLQDRVSAVFVPVVVVIALLTLAVWSALVLAGVGEWNAACEIGAMLWPKQCARLIFSSFFFFSAQSPRGRPARAVSRLQGSLRPHDVRICPRDRVPVRAWARCPYSCDGGNWSRGKAWDSH